MASDNDAFAAEFVTPAMAAQFGERDADNQLAAVLFYPKGREENPLEPIGVAVGPLDLQMVESGGGTFARRETVTIWIPRKLNDQLEGRILQKATFRIPRFGEAMWAVADAGSKVDELWIEYHLERQPLANLRDHRRATI